MTTACPDWESRIVNRQSLIPARPLYPAEAEKGLAVFKALKVVDAIGSPTFGETAGQWVLDLVAAVFGAYNEETKIREISEFFVLVSKKNGKSLLAAGIMLTALIRQPRPSQELIILAPSIKAANNSFKPAADMVRADPRLDASQGGFLHVVDHERKIKHLVTGATLQVLSADAGIVVGVKAGFVLIDEMWKFGESQKANAMLREATGGLVTRPEGFQMTITTQSDKPPAGEFLEKLKRARKIRNGEIIDPRFLPVLYEFPDHMIRSKAYLDINNCYVTNPYLSTQPYETQWLRDEMAKEMDKDISSQNVFLSKHLNVEIQQAQGVDRWSGAEKWAKGADKTITLQSLIEKSDYACVGIDGGGR